MNIILLGYRGSGKSTLGRMLADQLWKTFVDVDRLVCKHFDNPSIADIWAKHGEGAWREAEVRITQELCLKDEQVIALGGGTLMQAGARKAVEDASDTVRIYLYCDTAVLAQRIAADSQSAATRPNLTGKGGGIEEIIEVLALRDPVYRAVADKVFDVTNLAPADAVGHLIKRCL